MNLTATGENSDFITSMTRRMSPSGSTIVGIAGIVLAINAALEGEFVGAGVCLIASALAFGVMGYTFSRR